MGEVSYIGYEALKARAMEALRIAVTQGAEHLAGEQQQAAPVDTGTLRASIHVAEIQAGGLSVTARTATSGESGDYAVHVHEGTLPHWIQATTAQALWWPGARHPVPAVVHPGTKPVKYMERPLLDNAALLREFLRRAAMAAF